MRNMATAHANSMNLGEYSALAINPGTGPKAFPGNPYQACNNDTDAHICQFIAYFYQIFIKKLGFVDTDNVDISESNKMVEECRRRSTGWSLVVGDHFCGRIPGVDSWFENSTRCLAISARRSRRINSSVLPENIDPTMTSISHACDHYLNYSR